MQYLKQSTAATVLVGPVLDADGVAVTGAVIGDFRLAKNGTVTTMSGNTISHSHNGCYLITLTTANTDTLDRLSISVGNTSYSMTVFRYTVLTSGMFDALVTNGRILRSTNSNSTVLVTGSNHAAADVHAFQTNALTGDAIDATAVIKLQTGLAGTGARTVTITVNDGTNVLQNARVRLTEGANTYSTLTNASGVATFNLDDATYVVSISKQGYSYAGTTLVVDGTETATYSMTLISLTASDVDKVTGYWIVLDAQGNEASGVVVTVKARQASRGSAGALHDAATRTATSAANGLVQFTNMIPGWRYSVVANDEYVADFTVPADAVTSVELGSIVARLT